MATRKKKARPAMTGEAFAPEKKPDHAYMKTGFCGVCLCEIEAMQPGGFMARHVYTQRPVCKG